MKPFQSSFFIILNHHNRASIVKLTIKILKGVQSKSASESDLLWFLFWTAFGCSVKIRLGSWIFCWIWPQILVDASICYVISIGKTFMSQDVCILKYTVAIISLTSIFHFFIFFSNLYSWPNFCKNINKNTSAELKV